MKYTYRSDKVKRPLLPSYHIAWGVMDWVFMGFIAILAVAILSLPVWINYL